MSAHAGRSGLDVLTLSSSGCDPTETSSAKFAVMHRRGNPMRRRKFIALLGSSAVAWPLIARGQQLDRTRRIGMLMSASENDAEYQGLLATFGAELKKMGWEQGRNI